MYWSTDRIIVNSKVSITHKPYYHRITLVFKYLLLYPKECEDQGQVKHKIVFADISVALCAFFSLQITALRRAAIQPSTYLFPEILFCSFAYRLGGHMYRALRLRLLCNPIYWLWGTNKQTEQQLRHFSLLCNDEKCSMQNSEIKPQQFPTWLLSCVYIHTGQ